MLGAQDDTYFTSAKSGDRVRIPETAHAVAWMLAVRVSALTSGIFKASGLARPRWLQGRSGPELFSTTRRDIAMSKFNTKTTRTAAGTSAIRATSATPTTRTALGGAGYERDAKGELFALAVANFVGEGTFHEGAGERDERYNALVRQVAVEDPQWTLEFLGWLRNGANMRTASVTGAIEAVKARLDAGMPSVPAYELPGRSTDRGVERVMIDAVMARADEPGEAIAYHFANYGRKLPKPMKRGLADAAARLYNQYSLLKYDTPSHGVRFADVIELTHPSPATPEQGALFKYAIDRRHGHDVPMLADALPMIVESAKLRAEVAQGEHGRLLDPERLKRAGFTWEDALSLAGPRVDKAALWAALAPSMGYMALLRNLRNFDEANVGDDVANVVIARLTDPVQVARSRQLPFRFYSAYREVPSDRWRHALSVAADLSLSNVPVLSGRNLVLVDTSASMTSMGLSARSKATPAQAAALFGAVVAKRTGGELWGFANGQFEHKAAKGESTLRTVERFLARTGEVGHGTELQAAVRKTFDKHDRVFVISDEQTVDSPGGRSMYGQGVDAATFGNAQVYAFNLGGYTASAFGAQRNVHHLGGLTDATFRMIPLLERGQDAPWPWQVEAA
jgi:hypothetical protein